VCGPGNQIQDRGAAVRTSGLTSCTPAARYRVIASAILAVSSAIGISCVGLIGQTKAVERSFKVGSDATFRVELNIHSSVEGQKPTTIGEKTYVQPILKWVEQDVVWRAERRVESVTSDGVAEIEESLDNFSNTEMSSIDDADTHKLLEALAAAIKPWKSQRTLRYRETPDGKIAGLDAEASPPLDEAAPRVLTAWLLRALRPTVALPTQPLVFGKSWQEPRSVQFAEWAVTSASETGEWLGDTDAMRKQGEPTVQLHTTQQFSGKIIAGSEKPNDGSALGLFYAESVSTMALDDLRFKLATRTATRETIWTLSHVEGLPAPPQFKVRLSVGIRIQVCDEKPCIFYRDISLRDPR